MAASRARQRVAALKGLAGRAAQLGKRRIKTLRCNLKIKSVSGQTHAQPPYCSPSEPKAGGQPMNLPYGTLANRAIFVLLTIWVIHTW